MIIRPVFNILLLPDITYFFKRDFFPGAAADQIEVGTDILFPFLKNYLLVEYSRSVHLQTLNQQKVYLPFSPLQ